MPGLTRACHVQWLYFRIIVRELRWTLVAFLAINLVGAWLFHEYYHLRGTGERPPDYIESLHTTFAMVFMEYTHDFPAHPLLRVQYFVVPILGLVAIADGLVRFGVLLVARDQNRDTWARVMAQVMKDHVILCGLGRVGFRILEQLRRLGDDVVVIERLDEDANSFVKEARRLGVPVLVGDARREQLLESAHVAGAKSVIAATDDDMTNIEVALDARAFRPDIRVVLRMFEQATARKLAEAFQFHAVLSTAGLAAPAFAAAASDRNILQSFDVEGMLLVVAQLEVGPRSRLVGRTITEVLGEHGVAILSRRPSGGAAEVLPRPDARLAVGDRLKVQAKLEAMPKLHEANGEADW